MAITRRWQAGAEVDTTNSWEMEFDSRGSVDFTASADFAKSGTYSFKWRQLLAYGLQSVPATRQIRVGFHWYADAYSTHNEQTIVRICGVAVANNHMEIRGRSGTGGLTLYVNGAERDTKLGAYVPDQWIHVGINIKVDNVAGWAKVYLDGAEALSFVGNTGNTDIENVAIGNLFGASHWPSYCYTDNIYIDDTTGEATAPVPDLRFEFISPNGVGNYEQWDPFPGGGEDNYEDVDERPNDGDTTYVEAQVLNEKDSYAMTTYTMNSGWTIEAVIPTAIAKKTDGGTDTELALMTRQGGTDDEGSAQDLPTSYGLLWERFPLDPGGGAWSQADLDSVECGVVGKGTF